MAENDPPPELLPPQKAHPSAEEIYQAYPRKVKKPPALKAIANAMKKCDPARLLERTKAYAAAIVWQDHQFIPHPSTWFNAEQFNDDPTEWENPAAHPVGTAPSMPTAEGHPDHAAIVAQINALRPEWGKPAHWSAAEMQGLHGALPQFHELTPDDWELLKKFLAAHLDKAAGYWQPPNRGRFVSTFPDVFSSAQRWAQKTGVAVKPKPKIEHVGGWR